MRMPPGVRRAFRLPSTAERIARELDDEVRFHVERRAEALMAQGLSRDAAYAEAVRRFGDVDDLKDYCVSIEVTHMQRANTAERASAVMQDLRYAMRQFRKAPGFTFIAALTLALGIGASTAIFSVVNGVVLRPLPFPNSERMVQLWGLDAKGRDLPFADPTFDAVAHQSRAFSAVAEVQAWPLSLVNDGEATRVLGATVSKEFFDVLQVKPERGRFFVADDQQLGAPTAVVISDGLWRRQFAGSMNAIGARLMSGTTPMTVVGVMPAGQEYPAGADVWMARERNEKNTSYTAHNFRVIGRLRDGVTLPQANQDLSLILQRLHQSLGDATWTFDGRVLTLREQIVGRIKPLLLILLSASAVLLLIACANVANLLVARLAVRESEIAVRLALGASRYRLAQQLLLESLLLAAIGCIGGLLFTFGGMKVLLVLRPTLIPRVGELHVDWVVLLFAVAVSTAMALGLGLVAAWRSAAGDLRSALSHSQRTMGGGGASYRIRGALVVVQLTMTVVLLVGAGVLGRSFVRLMAIDTGFRNHGMVVSSLAFEGAVAERTQYFDELARRAAALPGVTSIGVSDAPPFSGGSSNGTFVVLEGPNVTVTRESLEPLFRDKSRTGYASYRMANGGYFKTMNIPLISGRYLDDRDREGAPEVAVISASLAKKQWPGQNPLGKAIEFGNIDGDLTPLTVVGVVGDVRANDLAADPQPAVYVSYRQRPGNGGDMNIIMATDNEAATIRSARTSFREVRADVPMRFTTVEEIIGRSVATQRFMLLLVGVFGGIALLLATLGVYSVISYLVAQRERELSIRVALGARASDIRRLVLSQGIGLVAGGLGTGGVAALFATRLLKGLLYQVTPTDPIVFAGVVVLLFVVAVIASYLPARRAVRVDPIGVMRGA